MKMTVSGEPSHIGDFGFVCVDDGKRTLTGTPILDRFQEKNNEKEVIRWIQPKKW